MAGAAGQSRTLDDGAKGEEGGLHAWEKRVLISQIAGRAWETLCCGGDGYERTCPPLCGAVWRRARTPTGNLRDATGATHASPCAAHASVSSLPRICDGAFISSSCARHVGVQTGHGGQPTRSFGPRSLSAMGPAAEAPRVSVNAHSATGRASTQAPLASPSLPDCSRSGAAWCCRTQAQRQRQHRRTGLVATGAVRPFQSRP